MTLRLRETWRAYAASPLYNQIRRIHFGVGMPVYLAAAIFLVIVRAWFPGALVLVAAAISAVGALRTPGSYLRRWARLEL